MNELSVQIFYLVVVVERWVKDLQGPSVWIFSELGQQSPFSMLLGIYFLCSFS